MTEKIENQNGDVKPQDASNASNASGPSSTGTPNSGPTTNTNNTPDSGTSSNGNENTVPKTNSEVGSVPFEGSKKTRNKNKKRRKKKKRDAAAGAVVDANATEVAGEKTQEPQKDDPESVPPVVDGQNGTPEAQVGAMPRGKEGKLSRKQRRKLNTPQGGTGTVDSDIASATGSPPESVEEPRGKDGTLSRKQRRLLRETKEKEAESSAPAAAEVANGAKQEPADDLSKLPRTLPVVVQLDTSTENQGHLPVHVQLDVSTVAADSKEIGGGPLSPRKEKEDSGDLKKLVLEEEAEKSDANQALEKAAAVDKAVLETVDASSSAPEEETTTASRDNAKTVEAEPEKAETKTKAASESKARTVIAYEDDNTGKKDDCECSGCVIS
jgi:hypothetical protein